MDNQEGKKKCTCAASADSFYEEKPYRAGVGLVLLNDERKVLIAQRNQADLMHAWQFPQGGMEDEETPEEALFREAQEEIGTQALEILAQTPHWISYDFPRCIAQKVWGGLYRGQKHIWFLCRLNAEESAIHLNRDIPEFSSWCWIAPEEVLAHVVPFKKKAYTQVLETFSPWLVYTPATGVISPECTDISE